jgi:hypothetical protein
MAAYNATSYKCLCLITVHLELRLAPNLCKSRLGTKKKETTYSCPYTSNSKGILPGHENDLYFSYTFAYKTREKDYIYFYNSEDDSQQNVQLKNRLHCSAWLSPVNFERNV